MTQEEQKVKTYKIVDSKGNRRVLTASNITEAIITLNWFKKHHSGEWALVLGTLDQFPTLCQ